MCSKIYKIRDSPNKNQIEATLNRHVITKINKLTRHNYAQTKLQTIKYQPKEALETLGQFYQIKHTNVDIFMSLWTPKSSTFETLII